MLIAPGDGVDGTEVLAGATGRGTETGIEIGTDGGSGADTAPNAPLGEARPVLVSPALISWGTGAPVGMEGGMTVADAGDNGCFDLGIGGVDKDDTVVDGAAVEICFAFTTGDELDFIATTFSFLFPETGPAGEESGFIAD